MKKKSTKKSTKKDLITDPNVKKKFELPLINQGSLKLYLLAAVMVFAIILSILQGLLKVPPYITRISIPVYCIQFDCSINTFSYIFCIYNFSALTNFIIHTSITKWNK